MIKILKDIKKILKKYERRDIKILKDTVLINVMKVN